MQIQKMLRIGLFAASLLLAALPSANAQATPNITVEQPDAERTRNEFTQLIDRYPPSLRSVLAQDPGLLSNAPYLSPYPALAAFLGNHPEIARNPSFFISPNIPQPHAEQVLNLWREVFNWFSIVVGFGMAFGLIIWLIRTLVDYRRWNRLTKIQTEVHTKLLDRFTANEDLLTYMQSPAGAKFLESSPISLDPGPRSVAAPFGRILWSIQAGLVVAAAGIGLQVVSSHITDEASQPIRALGILGVALGVGFVVSAIISYLLSRRLGLIEPPAKNALPIAQQ